jgi:hypothetical protein
MADTFAYKTLRSEPAPLWFDPLPDSDPACPARPPEEIEQFVSEILASYSNIIDDLPRLYYEYSALIKRRTCFVVPEAAFESDFIDLLFSCFEPPLVQSLSEIALPLIRFFYTRHLDVNIDFLLERNLLGLLLGACSLCSRFGEFVIPAIEVLGDIARRSRRHRDCVLSVFSPDVCADFAARDEDTAASVMDFFWVLSLDYPLDDDTVEGLLEVTANIMLDNLTDDNKILDEGALFKSLKVFHHCAPSFSGFSRWMHRHHIDVRLQLLLARRVELCLTERDPCAYWILSVFADLLVTDVTYYPCFPMSIVLSFVNRLGLESEPIAVEIDLQICRILQQWMIREHVQTYEIMSSRGMPELLSEMFEFGSFELRCQIIEVWKTYLAVLPESLDDFMGNRVLIDMAALLDCGDPNAILALLDFILTLAAVFRGAGKDASEITEQVAVSTGLDALLDLCMGDDELVANGAAAVCDALGLCVVVDPQ